MTRVLILTNSEGHLSLAQAVDSLLKKEKAETKIVNFFDKHLLMDLYRLIYRFFPLAMKVPFYLTQTKHGRYILEFYSKHIIQKKLPELEQIISEFSPHLIISTYFGYIPLLDNLKPSLSFKYIQLISDPVTIHPALFSFQADYNLGFDQRTVKLGLRLGLKRKQLKAIGWLVRPEFYQLFNKKKILKQLGLSTKKLTCLICGGSEGSNAIISSLPILLFQHHHQPFQFIFVSGSNKRLKKIIDQSILLATKLGFKENVALSFGFSHKMAEYIAASDCVIGKAGPNLIFESVAQKKPFIAISHINGQEDGNLKLIKDYHLGWQAENPLTFYRLMKKISYQPELLAEKKSYLYKLSRHNRQAARKFLTIYQELKSSP